MTILMRQKKSLGLTIDNSSSEAFQTPTEGECRVSPGLL